MDRPIPKVAVAAEAGLLQEALRDAQVAPEGGSMWLLKLKGQPVNLTFDGLCFDGLKVF